MIDREIEKTVKRLRHQYPVLTITGPRQSGKTTLSKKLFPQYKYLLMEDPDTRQKAKADPRQFLSEWDAGIIIDEFQNAPELLSYIQGMVDAKQINGRIILTGSQHFLMMKNISQSLAGRTAIITLLPFTVNETRKITPESNLDRLILKGFMPRIWDQHLEPYQAYRDYFRTYIQRDLRDIASVNNLELFTKFVKLCAGRIGNIFNASNLSNEVGVSVPTIQSWLAILQTSYTIFLLNPYYENWGKRLIKSPKLYFYDIGLASYLLEIENTKQLSRDPARGSLFENLVVMELLKQRYNHLKDSNLYFYRDRYQKEVDVILKYAHKFKVVEIKSAQTFQQSFIDSNEYLSQLLEKRILEKYIVYAGKDFGTFRGNKVINYLNTFKIV
jgi:uncharacterized protein